jgi:hypothetical protein
MRIVITGENKNEEGCIDEESSFRQKKMFQKNRFVHSRFQDGEFVFRLWCMMINDVVNLSYVVAQKRAIHEYSTI